MDDQLTKNKRRASRRRDHIAKDLRTPKYRERSVPVKTREEEDERRFRRYHTFDEFFPEPDIGWHPYDQDEDDDN